LEPRLLLDASAPTFTGADLALWQQNYDPLGLNPNTYEMGDWNNDGRINGADLAIWQANYTPLQNTTPTDDGPLGDTPPAPGQPDLLASDDSGVSDSDDLTNVTTATIEIEAAQPGDTIRIYNDGVYLGDATLLSGTTYQYTFTAGQLAEGDNPITARASDGGDESPDSTELMITFDTEAPALVPPPELITSYGVGPIADVGVVGTLAYVADSGGALHVIDVSTPETPVLVGSCTLTGSPYAIKVEGTLACVTGKIYGGLQIVDISVPSSPTLLSYYDLGYFGYGVDVVGNLVYVGSASGLQILDIAIPSTPTFVGSYGASSWVYGVTVDGSLAYLADSTAGLKILDISNPAAPTLVGSYNTPVRAHHVEVAGALAYVSDEQSLQIIDISTPSAPTFVGKYDTPPLDHDANHVRVVGTLAYLSDSGTAGGLTILNVSDPSVPTLVNRHETPGDAQAVAVVGSLAYVADDGGGLQIVDVSSPSSPLAVGSKECLVAYDVEVVGSLAYVADYANGLEILDVSDPSSPVFLGAWSTVNEVWDVEVADGLAYLAHRGGMTIIDVSVPSSPAFVGKHSQPDSQELVFDVELVGTFAYLGTQSSGMRVVDVAVPSLPTDIGGVGSSTVRDIAISGDEAYYGGPLGVRGLDVSTPSSPLQEGFYATMGSVMDIKIAGAMVYTVTGYRSSPAWVSGLEIIDFLAPSSPQFSGSGALGTNPTDLEVSDGRAYLTNTSGLKVMDVTDPAIPTQVAYLSVSGTRDLCLSDHTLYLGAGRVKIVDRFPPAIDLVDGSDTGLSSSDNVTADASPTLEVAGSSEYVCIYRDGTLASTEYETSPVTLGVQPYGMFEYTARAVDAAGNVSEESEPLMVTILAPGDANEDGKVDGADLAIWQQHYDPLGLNPDNDFSTGDWNDDGKIDGGDLAMWQQNYNPLGV